MTVTTQRMEQALTYLAETDDKAAYHKSHVARTEYKAKAIRQSIFLVNPEKLKTVAERQAYADNCDEYEDAMFGYFEALREYEHVRNKRSTEALVVEVWRSVNSARNKGQIV